jgi:ABC-type glycerol-3-phosphate transport system permease component
MFAQGRYTLDYGLVAGIVTLAIIPIILVYVVFQRAFIQGITAGALKG